MEGGCGEVVEPLKKSKLDKVLVGQAPSEGDWWGSHTEVYHHVVVELGCGPSVLYYGSAIEAF